MTLPAHTKTVSVRELREHFPQIRKEMDAGMSFILIYRSRPIGELRPLRSIKKQADLSSLEGVWKRSPLRRLGSVRAQHELIKLWS